MRDNSDASTTSRGSEPRPKRRGWARNNYYLVLFKAGSLKIYGQKVQSPSVQCLLMVLESVALIQKNKFQKCLNGSCPIFPRKNPDTFWESAKWLIYLRPYKMA